MKRAAEERHLALRIKKHFMALETGRAFAARDLPLNYYRKTWKAAGCRKARCYLCHYPKLFGLPKPSDLRANDKYRDQSAELNPNLT